MEDYIKLKDLEKVILEVYQEPEYWHTGETYYAGICAVSMAVPDIPTTQIPEPAEWLPYSHTMMECSACKKHTPIHKYRYCPHCGAPMKGSK